MKKSDSPEFKEDRKRMERREIKVGKSCWIWVPKEEHSKEVEENINLLKSLWIEYPEEEEKKGLEKIEG